MLLSLPSAKGIEGDLINFQSAICYQPLAICHLGAWRKEHSQDSCYLVLMALDSMWNS